jgi:cobalamin synthase
MTTILDLPLHPLAVHAPIILVALLVLLGLAYLLIPPLRRRLGWAVAILALVTPAAAYGSIFSGQQLADYTYPDGWPEAVQQHHDNGYWLFWTLVALIPVWFLFAALERGRRTALLRNADAPAAGEEGEGRSGSDDPAATGRKVLMFVIGLVAFALLLMAAWVVYRTGHTGAEMVWGGTVR